MTAMTDDGGPTSVAADAGHDATTALRSPDGAQASSAASDGASKQQRSLLVPVLSTATGALIAGMFVLAAVGFNALRSDIQALDARITAKITALDTKIDTEIAGLDAKITALDAKIDTQIGMLRHDMNEGFAQVNAILLDHTERLARLEAVHGIPHSHSALPQNIAG